MCDTIVAVPPATVDGAVWFGKNSDREPGEAQLVEHRPAQNYSAPTQLRCTHISIPQANHTYEVILSRPFWMWGAEMGTNERGVTIGNEAVFTRLPYAKEGLTGMDLLRLALERADCARAALQLITDLIARHGQGGGCGYRNTKFRYHNSFIIADPQEAWVLETADKYWVAEKVKGIRTISNVLTIGKEFDLISPDAYEFARSQGWCQSSSDFDFAQCFGDAKRPNLSAGDIRRACTLQILSSKDNGVGREDFFTALRDHNGMSPRQGWKIQMPCAHSSWWPTRRSGQTTGSMVSRLDSNKASHYLTGTSSPCLSVFKPVNFETEVTNIFWLHEKLHREVLMNYDERAAVFAAERRELERRNLDTTDGWKLHQQAIPHWLSLARGIPPSCVPGLAAFKRYWRKQNSLDGLVEEGVSGRT